jgi:hypothetical protein
MKLTKLTPEIIACMNPADQEKYTPGQMVAVGRPSYEEDPHPPPVTDRLEREEQRLFASWCLRKMYPCVWHSTRHRSKASLGCPDFIVGVRGMTLWIEFKRAPNKLQEDQVKFRELMLGQGITYHLVYSADEAIKLVEGVRTTEVEMIDVQPQ